MRGLIAIAVLCGLTGLAVFPAEAGSGIASRGSFGHVVVTSHARLQIVSVQGRKAIIVNRAPRHFAQRGFSQGASFGRFDQFGRVDQFGRFNQFGRFDQFVGDGFFGLDGGAVGASPSVIVVPQPVAASAAPARAAAVADLPPCREMTAGVLVQRGTACRRGATDRPAGTDQ